MKILQVCPKFHHSVASGSTMIAYYISKELARRGHSVTVYTSDMKDKYTRINSGIEKIGGVKVHRFRSVGTVATRKMKIFVTPMSISALKNEVCSFDIVHVHECRSFQSVVVHHYAKKYGVPYVLQAHGSLPRIGSWRRLKWFYDVLFGYRLLRDASKVIALNQMEAEHYKNMGVPEEKIAIIPNGIDLSEYANLPPKGAFKRKFGIPEDKKIILYLGRIHKIKGIDFLIKAYAYLTKKMDCKDAVLVIAGPDDGYLNEAKTLACSLGVSDSVLFTGLLSEKDKINAFVDSCLCAYLGQNEPFGIVTLESAASCTPVIVCEQTPMSDIVKDGDFGFSVKYGDINELAEIMHKMVNDENLLREMGRKGREFVFENYNWANIITKLEKIYEEL